MSKVNESLGWLLLLAGIGIGISQISVIRDVATGLTSYRPVTLRELSGITTPESELVHVLGADIDFISGRGANDGELTLYRLLPKNSSQGKLAGSGRPVWVGFNETQRERLIENRDMKGFGVYEMPEGVALAGAVFPRLVDMGDGPEAVMIEYGTQPRSITRLIAALAASLGCIIIGVILLTISRALRGSVD